MQFGFRWKNTYFTKKMRQIVGIEMAMYNFHQSSKNTLKMGRMINPIDQKNSNTNDVIVFAAPPVISTTTM